MVMDRKAIRLSELNYLPSYCFLHVPKKKNIRMDVKARHIHASEGTEQVYLNRSIGLSGTSINSTMTGL